MALDKAGIPYDWDALEDGHPVRGVAHGPSQSKILDTRITFLLASTPLTIRVVLCVLQSDHYRFLIGRDFLSPLKFSISDQGL